MGCGGRLTDRCVGNSALLCEELSIPTDPSHDAMQDHLERCIRRVAPVVSSAFMGARDVAGLIALTFAVPTAELTGALGRRR